MGSSKKRPRSPRYVTFSKQMASGEGIEPSRGKPKGSLARRFARGHTRDERFKPLIDKVEMPARVATELIERESIQGGRRITRPARKS